MGSKSDKTRNTDRRSGKAWGRNHDSPTKVLSAKQQERKVHKDAERERRRKLAHPRGSSITLHKITWEWAGEIMNRRWPSTHKTRLLDSFIAQGGGRTIEDSPFVVEVSPGVFQGSKAKATSKKNGR